MNIIKMPGKENHAEEMVVGLPRAFLYYRYKVLWETFFKELGIRTVVSPDTNLEIMKNGAGRAASEMCMAMKIYMGHVEALEGKCTHVLVPRILDFGIRRVMCTNFEALPDLVSNVFRDCSFQVLSYDVDSGKRKDHRKAMMEMAVENGFSIKAASKAWKTASKAQDEAWAAAARKTEALYHKEGLKLILAGHSYIIEDEYIGKPVLQKLEKMGVTVIRADQVDKKKALRESEKASPTLKWELSREIVGSLAMHYAQADGIILLAVYPCALDSMVNDMLIHKNKITKVPVLQMTLDDQTGSAGLDTRLESFVDILEMRRGEQNE